MSPSAVIRDAWQLYKAHWRHVIPVAFIVFVIVALVSLVLAAVLGWFGAVLGGLVGLVGVFWVQAALVEAVRDIRDGRADLSIGETLRSVQPLIGTVVGAGLLAGLGIAVGLVLLIVPGLYLFTIWSLIMPVIVLERAGAIEAFGRSRELVRGNGWNVFGVIVLMVLVLLAFNIVLGIATFWLPDAAQGFVQNLVSNTLASPFAALALTLTYYALRPGEQGIAPSLAGAEPPPATP